MEKEIKEITIKIVDVIKDMPYEYWDKIKYAIDNLYLCSNLKNTLNGNKDILETIDMFTQFN